MILLDSHTWIWHVQGEKQLPRSHAEIILQNESVGIGVSMISLWEIAKAVESGGLRLPISVEDWLDMALAYPGIKLLPLTPRIVVESTKLPSGFHKDPADQIIVATARVYDCPLLTSDKKILNYPHVKLQL
ncbi:MAG: type II toxin-antitoxin system VapC family toxin [Pyrinomonadaceae bacterium]